ncbi:MAG: endopeptidase La [Candidatus Mcinerneyibacterium aminivorans]|uniref:Lon protease n=1 Tax=Candidatus Mcinerneyibacterium aminivorans TaxID=2703815 RepID=A0A5D0MHI5_9BACT|nr:MAG: endopeptidase La [Candidatus Mcinerneyibacterium aminivorans]
MKSKIVKANEVLPNRLFILPLKSRPIFPGIVAPITVSDEDMKEMIDDIMERDHLIGFLYMKNDVEDYDEITEDDLYEVGTVAKIFKKVQLPEGQYNILVNTIKRFEVKKFISMDPYITAAVDYQEDILEEEDAEIKALTKNVYADIKYIIENNPLMSKEMKLNLFNIDEDPGTLADLVVSILNVEPEQQQEILEIYDVKKRLNQLLVLLNQEKEMLKMQNKIRKEIEEKVSERQREYFLREQLKMIKKELGIEKDEKTQDVEQFKERFEKIKSGLNEEAEETIEKELEKLELLETKSAEYGVVRNYLDTLLSLPWDERTDDNVDIDRAQKILDKDHYGLEDVKDRILEFLAVKKMKPSSKGSIVLLVGPPGVGKTSVGRSLARAMNRKFYRFSLGGMKDESEIKGHRRTYVGAMPGKIMQALKTVKSKNPIIMLDEVDKLAISYQGDPSAALLEVLDPEQNSTFRDHYLDVPFDLSEVLFICTANKIDTIPRPLLDRMENIRLPGYIDQEKVEIGKQYLVPKSLEQHGIDNDLATIRKSALRVIAKKYAREAGVRDMEKNINKIVRKMALKLAKKNEEDREKITVYKNDVEDYLGKPRFEKQSWQKITKPGMVKGLAWTPMGGDTLVIEAIFIKDKSSKDLKLTGQLGDVMMESANIAYSYVKSVTDKYDIDSAIIENRGIHLHVPAGAIKKDGPSAGITMVVALLSLLTDKKINDRLAMTGEISLTGNVLPVGGIREKVVAAKRDKIKEIIIPEANKRNYEDIPDKVKKGITPHFVTRMEEVEKIVLK